MESEDLPKVRGDFNAECMEVTESWEMDGAGGRLGWGCGKFMGDDSTMGSYLKVKPIEMANNEV
jgi:hypothetical protein